MCNIIELWGVWDQQADCKPNKYAYTSPNLRAQFDNSIWGDSSDQILFEFQIMSAKTLKVGLWSADENSWLKRV